jgi:integrase
MTLREAFDDLVAGMKDGTIRTRSGGRYKPSAIRSYERGRDRIVARLGAARLSEVRRRDVQDVVDALLAEEWSASLIRNTLDPLRVVYRRALRRDEVTVDPTKGLEVPADHGRRDRFATPSEAAALIAALPEENRPLWAAAFYTGMRRGELRELRWSDVDLKAGVVRVARALDDEGTVIDTKTRAGARSIPLLGALKPFLAQHKLRTGRDGDDLVFGRTAREPFVPSTVRRRAIAAWEAAELEPIALHSARHSTASLLRAAGLDFKLISAIIGHASVAITFDRYTHLSPENLSDAAAQVDAYLVRAREAVRTD